MCDKERVEEHTKLSLLEALLYPIFKLTVNITNPKLPTLPFQHLPVFKGGLNFKTNL